MAARKRTAQPAGLEDMLHRRGRELPEAVQAQIASRQERQQFRTANADAVKEFEDDVAAFRKAVRTVKGDHTALLDKMIASSRRMVDLARE